MQVGGSTIIHSKVCKAVMYRR